jgi:hypothetical protein
MDMAWLLQRKSHWATIQDLRALNQLTLKARWMFPFLRDPDQECFVPRSRLAR